MALDFNVGELATRLRAALGVRGRIPLALDEYVIPVTVAANVTVPPWRRNPVFGQGSALITSPTVGNFARVVLTYPAGGGSGGPNSVFILTAFSLQPLNLVAASGAAIAANIATATFQPGGTAIGGSPVPLVTTERYDAVSVNMQPYQLPVGLLSAQNATAPPTQGASGNFHITRQSTLVAAVWTPCEMAIRPGQAIEFASQVPASATDLSGVQVNVQGLFYGLGGN